MATSRCLIAFAGLTFLAPLAAAQRPLDALSESGRVSAPPAWAAERAERAPSDPAPDAVVPPTPGPPAPGVPLDGGLGLLAVAGAALAGRRLRAGWRGR